MPLVTSAIAIVLGVWAVPGAAAATAVEDAAATALRAAEPAHDTVVARVDGSAVTLGELIVMRQNLPPEFQALPDEVLMEMLVDRLADQILLDTAAREARLGRSRRVQLHLRNVRRAALAEAYVDHQVRERVSDEAISAAYHRDFARAEPVMEVRAAHILVEDEATASGIMTLLAEGAEFSALATTDSLDATASRGGDLGWFAREDRVPALFDAAAALETGEVTGPVQSAMGWHVIRLDARRQRPVPPLDEVREEIAADLARAARAEVLEELRSGATIERLTDAVPPEAIRADGLIGD